MSTTDDLTATVLDRTQPLEARQAAGTTLAQEAPDVARRIFVQLAERKHERTEMLVWAGVRLGQLDPPLTEWEMRDLSAAAFDAYGK
jgi:hypothetical protein